MVSDRDRELQDFLKGVVGVVEATSYEEIRLHNEAVAHGMTWGHNSFGLLETVGYLVGMPVCIRLTTAVVNGHKLLFISPTSQVVDHRMIDEWMKKSLPPSAFVDGDPRKHPNRADAMNFWNVVPR